MSVLQKFDLNKNFWHENPQLKVPFSETYSSDKSKNKSASSKLMWSIALYCDPESKFNNTTHQFKVKMIQEEYNSNFDPDNKPDQAELLSLYQDLVTTHAQKVLANWKRDLDERQLFLQSIKYSEDTDPELLALKEKWLTNTTRLWDAYQKALKDVQEEEQQTVGGQLESLSEQDII